MMELNDRIDRVDKKFKCSIRLYRDINYLLDSCCMFNFINNSAEVVFYETALNALYRKVLKRNFLEEMFYHCVVPLSSHVCNWISYQIINQVSFLY